jgi:hypothetical protein
LGVKLAAQEPKIVLIYHGRQNKMLMFKNDCAHILSLRQDPENKQFSLPESAERSDRNFFSDVDFLNMNRTIEMNIHTFFFVRTGTWHKE